MSTIVYQAQGVKIPQYETIQFTFDTNDGGTVNITDLDVYVPDNNPFYQYAKNAVSSLSVEAIGLKQFSIEKDNKVKDFYNLIQTTKWKKVALLDKETGIDDKAGVYMLYDENENIFYVGKAIKLKSRIIQHKKNANGNDPIPNFTHYRYSVISGEYYEFLYLIENAAIHDCAWLLDMPKAQKFTPSLAKSGYGIDKCKMVNTAEHQTRTQD